MRVASLEAIPADGVPRRFAVLAEKVDAWTRTPQTPIGAVYLRRTAEGDAIGKITALNVVCPHAGCFVAYMADRKVFQCPCHTSAFNLQGVRLSAKSPSPRDMDTLEVDPYKLAGGEVLVEYINYYPGKPNKEEKP